MQKKLEGGGAVEARSSMEAGGGNMAKLICFLGLGLV